MKNLGKIVLHIPARENSKRVPHKNIRIMNGYPMISYAIQNAIDSDVTKNIYVNTDSDEIEHYVKNNFDIKVYKRESSLANDKATSDQFNHDIIDRLKPDTLIMINPVCPLISPSDIKEALDLYKKSNCDTLISASKTQMQTFCDLQAVNINLNEELAPSQENKVVHVLNWAITIWNAKLFDERMNKQGFASMGEDRLLFELDHIRGIKVSEEEDFIFAEKILKINEK